LPLILPPGDPVAGKNLAIFFINHPLEIYHMMNAKKLTGLAIATAAAGLFALASAPMAVAGGEGKVKCSGVNACKGKGECATASNSCAGHNACKGKGWVHMGKADCEKKGGKVEN
jgi:hypothetical protein